MFAHLQAIFHKTDCDKPTRLLYPFQIKSGSFSGVSNNFTHLHVPSTSFQKDGYP
jgi:hypothetical protein